MSPLEKELNRMWDAIFELGEQINKLKQELKNE